MPNNITETIDRYCQAWSETDPDRRAELLAPIWDVSATYSDPTVYELDRDALLEHIAKVQISRPSAKVMRTSKVDTHHTFARFEFAVFDKDGNTLRQGVDAVRVNRDGTKIEHVVGFFGSLGAEEGTS